MQYLNRSQPGGTGELHQVPAFAVGRVACHPVNRDRCPKCSNHKPVSRICSSCGKSGPPLPNVQVTVDQDVFEPLGPLQPGVAPRGQEVGKGSGSGGEDRVVAGESSLVVAGVKYRKKVGSMGQGIVALEGDFFDQPGVEVGKPKFVGAADGDGRVGKALGGQGSGDRFIKLDH